VFKERKSCQCVLAGCRVVATHEEQAAPFVGAAESGEQQALGMQGFRGRRWWGHHRM
jgi:hypothetical protein